MAKVPPSVRFKELRRNLIRLDAMQPFFAWILYCYVRFVFATSRRTVITHPDAMAYFTGEKNAIFAFWHGRLLMIPPLKPKGRKMFVLISNHNDGELSRRVLSLFGVENVRGSTGKGGGKAALGVIRVFRRGANIAITPDGPRGPMHYAHAGIIHLARLCECPIIPFTVASSRHIQLRSWDKMQVALPFGQLIAEMGAPIHVHPEDNKQTVEADRQRLEDSLNAITRHADSLLPVKA